MRLRPRFTEVVSLSESEIRQHVLSGIAKAKSDLEYEDNDTLIIIKFKEDQRKLWTPQMEITFEEVEEGHKVRASVGPSGSIWLVFSFLYFGFSLAFLAALFYGMSQYFLNQPSSLFLSIAAMSFIALIGMYLVSYIGQTKSKEQIIFISSWFKEMIHQS